MKQLQEKLQTLRQRRGFDANIFLEQKTKRLNDFFAQTGLNAAVVGLSGGVDSALVAALLVAAAEIPDSPLQKIRCVIAPIHGEGTTGQSLAAQKAVAQCEALQKNKKLEYVLHDLSNAYQAIIKDGQTENCSPWAKGQMASVLRTPVFYYHAAILQEQGLKSLVVGTTNRDEGAYIGFWGKASDGMVDLQPIADMHKSEVYQLAKILGVLPEILEAAPRGDVWDGKIDEEMIGAPYWFLELYQLLLEYGEEATFSASLTVETLELYQVYKNNIEQLHRHNLHKYQVGSPAHYIDVLQRIVFSGATGAQPRT